MEDKNNEVNNKTNNELILDNLNQEEIIKVKKNNLNKWLTSGLILTIVGSISVVIISVIKFLLETDTTFYEAILAGFITAIICAIVTCTITTYALIKKEHKWILISGILGIFFAFIIGGIITLIANKEENHHH